MALSETSHLDSDKRSPISSSVPSDSAPTTCSYLLLFRNGGPEAHAHLDQPQRAVLATQWNTWVEGLIAQGALEQGRPLGLDGRVVAGPGGARVTDGPYA